jgi:hypothetical protein
MGIILMEQSSRWDLHKFDFVNNKIIVFDMISKRQKSFHVPNSTHAILKESSLFVSTSDNKVMKISLDNGSRKLIEIEDYKNLNL